MNKNGQLGEFGEEYSYDGPYGRGGERLEGNETFWTDISGRLRCGN